jgi:hypothetical protein
LALPRDKKGSEEGGGIGDSGDSEGGGLKDALLFEDFVAQVQGEFCHVYGT